jgi:hypothetical protein
VAGEPPAELIDDDEAVEEAVAEEAFAEAAPSADGNDGLVEEAVADLEPAPEAAEPAALAADTQPLEEAAPLSEAGTGEGVEGEERA